MPISPIHASALVALAILLTLLVGGVLRRSWTSSRARRRTRRGLRAEARGERLLVRRGYTILDRQVRGTWPLLVDGEEVEAGLRADLLVERRGRVYVAEVKSGLHGARATAPDTRRQLLEYRLAFECDGVLLVDMVRERVVEVGFPLVQF